MCPKNFPGSSTPGSFGGNVIFFSARSRNETDFCPSNQHIWRLRFKDSKFFKIHENIQNSCIFLRGNDITAGNPCAEIITPQGFPVENHTNLGISLGKTGKTF